MGGVNPRRSLLSLILAALLLGGTACTGTGPEAGEPTNPPAGRPEAGPSAEPEPMVDVTALDAELGAAITALYTPDGEVAVSDRLGDGLDARTAPPTELTAEAATGSWSGEELAIVTAAEDVTLLVRTGDAWTVVGGWWPSMNLAGPHLGGRQHVLLIGGDAREGEGHEVTTSRADTLQVVGVDGAGGGGILGIARDLWVPLSTGGEGKINAAMVFGGPEAQQQTVADATGLPIDGHLVIGFEGFARLVHGLGGVVIDTPEGRIELTGAEALRWVRERMSLPGGDFDRSFNQGLLLAGVAAKIQQDGPSALPETLALLERNLSATNLSAEQVLSLAGWAWVADPDRIGHAVAKGPTATRDGQSVVLIDDDAQTLFDDFADGNLG